MRTTLDGEYKWIFHIVDRFSKFSSSFALRSKHAVEVSEKLALRIGLFGPPHILQCDNGTEFKDTVLVLLILTVMVQMSLPDHKTQTLN